MLRGSVTAEVRPSSPDRRKWLLILPEDDDDAVRLVEFEHAADADTDSWFAPEDVLDRVESRHEDLDALLLVLADRGIDTDAFDAPWKMDYPL